MQLWCILRSSILLLLWSVGSRHFCDGVFSKLKSEWFLGGVRKKVLKRDIQNPSNSTLNVSVESKPKFSTSERCNDDKASKDSPKWYLFRQQCYKVFATFEYFSVASSTCNTFNKGNLVSISNKEENLFVSELVYKGTRYGEAWIGYKFDEKNNKYQWTDKSHGVFVNWVYGTTDLDKTARCVSIVPGGQWNNAHCYNQMQFVCKKDPKVAPKDYRNIKIAIMVSIPVSSILIMATFVAYLYMKANNEVNLSNPRQLPGHFTDVVINNSSVVTDILENPSHTPKESNDKELKQEPAKDRGKKPDKRTKIFDPQKPQEHFDDVIINKSSVATDTIENTSHIPGKSNSKELEHEPSNEGRKKSDKRTKLFDTQVSDPSDPMYKVVTYL